MTATRAAQGVWMAEPLPSPPDPPSPAEHRRAVIAAGAALLLLEGATRRAMNVALATSIKIQALHGPVLGLSVVATAQAITIAKARSAARAKAALSFEAQTSLDGVPITSGEIAADARRAQQAAKELADRFAKLARDAKRAQIDEAERHAAEHGKDDGPYRSAPPPRAKAEPERVAARELEPSLDRTASTEVADAWNEEWRRTVDHYVARGLSFVHEWNAEADACEKCHGLHGEIVHDDDRFSEGDPPIHPRCRCRIDTYVEQ